MKRIYRVPLCNDKFTHESAILEVAGMKLGRFLIKLTLITVYIIFARLIDWETPSPGWNKLSINSDIPEPFQEVQIGRKLGWAEVGAGVKYANNGGTKQFTNNHLSFLFNDTNNNNEVLYSADIRQIRLSWRLI